MCRILVVASSTVPLVTHVPTKQASKVGVLLENTKKLPNGNSSRFLDHE